MALGIAIAGALALLLVLLALPVHLSFDCRGVEGFNARIKLRCLLGLLRFGVKLPRDRRPQRQSRRAGGQAPVAARVPAERRAAGPRRASMLAVLGQPAFRRRVLQLGKELVDAAHLHRLRLRLRLGLGDPADTGHLWAVMGPLSAMAANLQDAQLRIEPEFVDAAFEFRAEGQARLVPLQVLSLLLVFALSPTSLRAWRAFRGGRG